MLKKQKLAYSILVILLTAAVLIWLAIFGQTSDNLLKVYFFDVGQGDSIFIETPAGRQVLIDGGPDKTVLEELNQVMPFHDRTIDLVILTHPDADHITGLIEVLEYYQVGHILTGGFQKETVVYQKWQEIINRKNIPLTLAQAGQKIIFPTGLILEILWPEQSLMESLAKKANDASVVGRLIYGQTEFLLTGDIERGIENYLVSHCSIEELESDILKVPHHGSRTSTGREFLKAVNPQIAVISVGRENHYGHPHPDILERLKDVFVYRTDQNGRIQISTNGVWFKVKTAK